MMLEETRTERFDAFNRNARRIYRKQKDNRVDVSSADTNKVHLRALTVDNQDWNRLLLARLKFSATGEYSPTGTTSAYRFDAFVCIRISKLDVQSSNFHSDTHIPARSQYNVQSLQWRSMGTR